MLFIVLTFFFLLRQSTSYEIGTLQTNQLFTFTGKSPGDNSGRMVKNAGDVNGDGYDDIIIGAWSANGGTGAVYVIYGQKDFDNIDLSMEILDPTSTGFYILGNTVGGYFGASVSGAGDINNDGYDDIIIGAYMMQSFRGIVYVVYGNSNDKLSNIDLKTQALDPTKTGFTITGNAAGDQFGYSVGSAKNFNGDQYDDIIIGSNSKGAGAAYVIYGKQTSSFTNIALSTSTLLPATTGLQFIGSGQYPMFGISVGFAGDLNGDGLSDVIIGAEGVAYVFYGKLPLNAVNLNMGVFWLDPATTGFYVLAKAQGTGFARATRAAGDVDGDGIDDIIIGETGDVGAAYVIYGRPSANIDLASMTLDPQTTGFVVKGSSLASNFGYSCDAADIDKDGYSDIIIGSSQANHNQGVVYVIYGRPRGELTNVDLAKQTLDPKTTGFTVSGIAVGDYFGHSISAAGDFDCDGKPDIAVGAFGRLNNRGSAYVISPSKICADNCDECRYPSRCKTCTLGYELLDDYTCSKCPEATYPLENACEDCSEGCQQCASGSICQGCYDGYTLLDSLSCLEKKHEVPQAAKAAAGLEGTSALGTFLSPGSSLPLYFTLSAKLIRNTRYLAVHVSEKLQIERFGWKTSSGMLSAPSSWNEKSDSEVLPTVFSQYDLEPVFLINYWKPLILSLISLGLFAIFKLLEKWHRAVRTLSIMASNIALTQLYTSLDDIFFFFVLDVRSGGFDTPFRTISYALAILLVIIAIVTLGSHIAFLHKYQDVKRHKGPSEFNVFVEKSEYVKLLFRDLKDESLIQQIFLFLHVTRGLLANIVTTTLFEYPMLKTCLLTLFSLCVVIFLLIKRPYRQLNVLCGQYFSEAILLIVNFCMLIMAAFDKNSSGSTNAIDKLSDIIYILNYVLYYGAMGFMALEACKSLYDVYQNQKKPPTSLQVKKIFHPREFSTNEFENNNHPVKKFQKNQIPKENLSFAQPPLQRENMMVTPPQTLFGNGNQNQVPVSMNDSLSIDVSPQIRPALNATNRWRSQTMPYHAQNNSHLESNNLDDSLNMSNVGLISDTPIRSHSKTVSHMQKMKRPGLHQGPKDFTQDSSILEITEENSGNKEVMRVRAQSQTRQEAPQVWKRQFSDQEYEDFLRRRIEKKAEK